MATGGRACGLHPWTHVFCFFSESESFFFPGNSPEEPSPELPEELVAGAGCGGGGGASGLPCLPYRRKQEQGQRQEQTEARVRVGCRAWLGGWGCREKATRASKRRGERVVATCITCSFCR
jgi:hypothetical protein